MNKKNTTNKGGLIGKIAEGIYKTGGFLAFIIIAILMYNKPANNKPENDKPADDKPANHQNKQTTGYSKETGYQSKKTSLAQHINYSTSIAIVTFLTGPAIEFFIHWKKSASQNFVPTGLVTAATTIVAAAILIIHGTYIICEGIKIINHDLPKKIENMFKVGYFKVEDNTKKGFSATTQGAAQLLSGLILLILSYPVALIRLI